MAGYGLYGQPHVTKGLGPDEELQRWVPVTLTNTAFPPPKDGGSLVWLKRFSFYAQWQFFFLCFQYCYYYYFPFGLSECQLYEPTESIAHYIIIGTPVLLCITRRQTFVSTSYISPVLHLNIWCSRSNTIYVRILIYT